MRRAGLPAPPQTGGTVLGGRRSGVVPLRMAGGRRALGTPRPQRNRRTAGREGAAEGRAGTVVEEEGAGDPPENARIAVNGRQARACPAFGCTPVDRLPLCPAGPRKSVACLGASVTRHVFP